MKNYKGDFIHLRHTSEPEILLFIEGIAAKMPSLTGLKTNK
jgi:hypothetical protein